jgi:ribulose-5-phosphate 4-epimerase/fuculose-1-phosphate aldolase
MAVRGRSRQKAPKDRAERELVAKSCRILGKLDLTKAATGHVSQRVGDRVLIRARGRDELGVRFTTREQVIAVDLDGNKLDGPDGLLPPQEVFIHTCLYRAREEVKSVVHIHPPTVVVFTICEVPLRPIYGAYDPSSLELALEGIPTYGRSITISNEALGRDFAKVMGGKSACMMRGHGVTTAGASVEEATVTAIKLNELAEMNYRARLLGVPRDIEAEDIAHFRSRFAKRSGASPRLGSTWRYYATVSGEE